MPKSTFDNASYHNRHDPAFKQQCVVDTLTDLLTVKQVSIIDYGCNTGAVTAPLASIWHPVTGIDMLDPATVLKRPYFTYRKADVVKDLFFETSTLAVCFSVYHHILGAYGLECADTFFLKLLLRSDYLLFDSGNVSEVQRKNYPWYKQQRKLFKNELELLQHFNLPFTTVGTYKVAGGYRTIVRFRKEDLDNALRPLAVYGRLQGTKLQKHGLIDMKTVKPEQLKVCKANTSTVYVYPYTRYYKLQYNGLQLFGKQYLPRPDMPDRNGLNELKHYKAASTKIPPEFLNEIYGISKKYGLISKWLNITEYCGKDRKLEKYKLSGIRGIDIVKTTDGVKYLDFE